MIIINYAHNQSYFYPHKSTIMKIMEKVWDIIKESISEWNNETKDKLNSIKKDIVDEYIKNKIENDSSFEPLQQQIRDYLTNDWWISNIFKDIFREYWLSILAPEEIDNLKKIKETLYSMKEIPTEESLSILKSEIMQTKNPKQSDEIPEKKSDFSPDSSWNSAVEKIDENNPFIKNVYETASSQIGKKYTRWWISPESWFDCSWLRNRAFKKQWIQFSQRLTAEKFSDADVDIKKEQVQIWDFMFWDKKPWTKKHNPIYHIEMIISKPYIKNGKTYVKTLWSSSDKKDDLWNYVWNWVRIREREMKSYRHYWRPTYYYQLAQYQKTWEKQNLIATANKPSNHVAQKLAA